MRSLKILSIVPFLLLFAVEVSAKESKTPVEPGSKSGADTIKVLFIGDSLTEGYQVPKESSFPSRVEAKLLPEFPSLTVVNAGISGSTTAGGLSRLKWHLRGTPKPKVMVLALGANDGLRGQPVSNITANLREVISLAKQEGMTVLLAGMKIPPNYGADYAKEFEAAFAMIAKEEAIDLIPFLLEGVAAEAELNLPDGIHPNAKGYEIVADTVIKHLKPILLRLTK